MKIQHREITIEDTDSAFMIKLNNVFVDARELLIILEMFIEMENYLIEDDE